MKKYLSLFIVLAMVFTISIKTTRAQDSGPVPTLYSEETLDKEVRPVLTREQRLKMEEELKEKRKTIQIEMRATREKALGSVYELGKDIRNKMEEENGEIPKELRNQIDARKEEARKKIMDAREKMDRVSKELRYQIKERRDEARQKMEGLRDGLKEEKDEVKAKIKEGRINGREKALERFDKVLERMSNFENKVNSHIANLELKGVDVTVAEGFMATVEIKLNEAKLKIVEINTLLSNSIDQLTLENKTTLRTLTQETQTLVKEAHWALNGAVKALKDAVKIKMEAGTNTTTIIPETSQ